MQIMAGLDKPTSGEIWFNNKNVTGEAVQKRNVSMVYQQFINYPNFTVYDNIASPLKITGIGSDEIKKRVGEVSEILKLSGMLSKKHKITKKNINAQVPLLCSQIPLPSNGLSGKEMTKQYKRMWAPHKEN